MLHSEKIPGYFNGLSLRRLTALVWGCLFVITFLIYLPALRARFVADFIDMVFYIPKHPSLFDFSHGIRFDFVNRAFFRVWLLLFGYSPLAWHTMQTFFHSLNAALLFIILCITLKHYNYYNWRELSLLISLCFILNPYHTEPVVWAGDINYLLVTCFILAHILSLILFIATNSRSYLLVASFTLLLAAFSHELGWFLLPADVVVAIIILPSVRQLFNRRIASFSIISALIMVLYFLNKSLSGNMMGHYGSEVHLNFSPALIIPTFYKYLLKILLLANFFPCSITAKTYAYLDRTAIYVLLSLFSFILFTALAYFSHKKRGLRLPLAMFVLFGIFILPVLNLYFIPWIKIDGDRYCYITSAFLLASTFMFLYGLRPIMAWLYGVIYLTASFAALSYNITSWYHAGQLSSSLEAEYCWKSAPHVYLLNVPDNFRGAYMYRSLAEPNTFCQSFIKYGSNIPDANKTTCVLGYNLNSSTDSVNVKIVGRNDLEVTLSAWGLWWWQNINSAGPARDSLMTIQTNNWGGYSVHFKRKQPGDVFLTCHNGHWRRVNGF